MIIYDQLCCSIHLRLDILRFTHFLLSGHQVINSQIGWEFFFRSETLQQNGAPTHHMHATIGEHMLVRSLR